jgi:membrane protein required for colicin V production
MIKEAGNIFNWIDYIILTIILLSTLIGILRGFIKESISLLVWIAAIIIAVKFFPMAGNYLHQRYVTSLAAANVIGFSGLFLSTLLIGLVVSVLLTLLIEHTGLTATDRLLGIIFGLARGILIVSLLLMLVNVSALELNGSIERSSLSKAFAPITKWLTEALPKTLEYAINTVQSDEKDKKSSSRQSKEESDLDLEEESEQTDSR